MAKKTLLEIVQDILNDLDGDEVSSINDTVEASQIAQIVKTTYENMSTHRNWPFQKSLIQLEAASDTTRPTHIRIPDACKEIFDISYNTAADGITRVKYTEMCYLEPDAFLQTTNGRDTDQSNIDQVVDFGGGIFFIRNDIAPTYWTSFDDEYVVFDSYDSDVDNTIQNSKTQVMAYVEEAMTLTDGSYPPIPNEAFPTLIAEAKSKAAYSLNQVVDSKAEKEARKGRQWLSQKVFKTSGGIKYPKRGRRSVK